MTAPAYCLIDASGLAHRTAYSSRELEREESSGLYGHLFLSQLMAIIERVDALCYRMRFPMLIPVLFWDEPTSKDLRRRHYPEYKLGRKKYKDVTSYIDELKEVLRDVSPRYVLSDPLWEADDLIAAFVGIISESKDRAIVVTRDQDLHQLLRYEGVHIFDPHEKQRALIGRSDFERANGFDPLYLPLYKAMVGDPSDNWPGIKGFGPKAMEEALGNVVDGFIEKGVYSNLSSEEKATVQLGLRLTRLPFEELDPEYALDLIGNAFEEECDDQGLPCDPNWLHYLEHYAIEQYSEDEVHRILI